MSLTSSAAVMFYIHFIYRYVIEIGLGTYFSITIVDILLYSTLNFLFLFTLITFYTKRNRWADILKVLYVLHPRSTNLRHSLIIYIEIFIESTIILLVFGYERYLHSITFKKKITGLYAIFTVQTMVLILIIKLQCILALSLRTAMYKFNLILSKSRRIYWFDIDNLLENFKIIVRGIKLFNEIFGWIILLFIFVVILKLLETINFNFVVYKGILDMNVTYKGQIVMFSSCRTGLMLVS